MRKKGKLEALDLVRGIVPKGVSCIYVRQAEALGLGHAVLCAKSVVGDEPFAVILPDDLINGYGSGVVLQMVQAFNASGSSQLGVEEVPREDTDKYGIVNIKARDEKSDEGNASQVDRIVEKPRPEQASSNLAVVGRYILTPRIFDLLETTERGAGGEIQLTDAISALLEHETVFAHRFTGKRYDCGSKLGYLKATVDFGLKHSELGDDFRHYISSGIV